MMKTIAVIFGSRSTEHDVSIITALASIIKPLTLSKQYQVEAVYISKDGSWFWDDKLKDISFFTSGKIEDFCQRSPKAELLFDNGLVLVKPSRGLSGRSRRQRIDIVFPATHGPHGEDGELMGLLEIANVPYVGCGLSASVIAMDKILAKQVTEISGVMNPKWLWCYSRDFKTDQKSTLEVFRSLEYPLFVKPAHLGSSIGISKVENKDGLTNALEVAAHYDDKIIVEEAVSNLVEVTLPIMGNDNPIAALVEHPLVSVKDFFDFDTKYIRGGKKDGGKKGTKGAQGYSDLPAKLTQELYNQVEQTGLTVYKILGCSGIARVDMLIDSESNKVYFNEVNPLPGSLYAHNWKATGVSNVELVIRLVDFAEERWKTRQRLNTGFDTSFLKQF